MARVAVHALSSRASQLIKTPDEAKPSTYMSTVAIILAFAAGLLGLIFLALLAFANLRRQSQALDPEGLQVTVPCSDGQQRPLHLQRTWQPWAQPQRQRLP